MGQSHTLAGLGAQSAVASPEGDGEPLKGFRQSYQGDGDSHVRVLDSRSRVTDTVMPG